MSFFSAVRPIHDILLSSGVENVKLKSFYSIQLQMIQLQMTQQRILQNIWFDIFNSIKYHYKNVNIT